MMMSRGVMWFLLMPVMNTCLSEPKPPPLNNNGTRWELLEAIADPIHIERGLLIPTPEYYRYSLWHLDDLFEKHCGPPCFMGLRHRHSRANLCYLATKEAIEEALILTCGMNVVEPGAVPQQQVPYGYLESGTPFASKWVPFNISYLIFRDILDQDANDNGVARLLNRATHVLVVTAIYLSCVGSPSAMVAVASCLALDYVTGSIIAPVLCKKTELPWEKFTDGWARDQVAEWVSSPGFKEWIIKNHHKLRILPDTSQD